jgi:hypothetical protein
MKCSQCNITRDDEPLYRNNPKGVIPADWRCEKHLDHPPDPDVKKISDIISRAGR